MLSRIRTCAIYGVDANAVDVEVEVRRGKPYFIIIGLADSAVRESRDRVNTALRHCGFEFPDQVLVNLAPAELKKEGSGFDLPIAVAVLAASEQIKIGDPSAVSFHGELALDGKVKPIRGMLAIAIQAREKGVRQIFVPAANADEVSLIDGLTVLGVNSVSEVVAHFRGKAILPWRSQVIVSAKREGPMVSDVWGQEHAKRALCVAAAGGHNLILIGPPGCGKSMLAERLPSILPQLSEQERREVIKIQSIAGVSTEDALSGRRPYRNPHHGVSDAGLIGGGSPPRPGEISLAHRGVLFLDEFPEFRRSSLEALRAPLESGQVRISRAKGSALMPAAFQLVAAMNPCPCGRLGDEPATCHCSRGAIFAYLRKLSQPILDRIDLHVEMQRVDPTSVKRMSPAESVESESQLRATVQAARLQQERRQGKANVELKGQELQRHAALEPAARSLLERACKSQHLSARVYSRLLSVALTIADLAGSETVGSAHIAEALSLRSLERLERYCVAA